MDRPPRRRELVYYVAVSLDGFIAAPDGSSDDFPLEGDHMDVVVGEYTDALPGHVQRALGVRGDLSRFDTVVMGWNTYTPALAVGIDSPYPHLRQYVVGSPERRTGAEVTLLQDPVALVRELKAEEGGSDVYLAGGGQLAGSLLEEVDRLVLKVNPLLLGDGIPLFGRRGHRATPLEVLDRRAFTSGVTIVEARPRR
ncbi:dihydrofolate reductase family protein [Kineococcus sp. SYSU DK004]|uniref:dihydrofolate reductase family protein n=1 Tax=Kineococcus sp. SYSU DK004 TaxID=3383125 RepID=UPI003D7E785A